MSIDINNLRKQLSDVRWHLGMTQDADAHMYAAVDGLADIVGGLIRTLPPTPTAVAAPTEPDHGQVDLEQATAALATDETR